MNPVYETRQIDWHGIAVSVGYCPDYSPSYREIYGYPLAHLTIAANRPLPMTTTGFRSHFVSEPVAQEWESPIAYVRAWLDADAQLPEWQEAQRQAQQLTLF